MSRPFNPWPQASSLMWTAPGQQGFSSAMRPGLASRPLLSLVSRDRVRAEGRWPGVQQDHGRGSPSMRWPARCLAGWSATHRASRHIASATLPVSDRVMPPSCAATMVGWARHSDHRRVSRACGTATGLAFGIGHGFLANRLTRHDPTPNRYLTKQGRRCLWISRCWSA